jgi:deoxycytidylate deaminase
MIVSSGIVRVIYHDEYRDTRGTDLLDRCGIKVFSLSLGKQVEFFRQGNSNSAKIKG